MRKLEPPEPVEKVANWVARFSGTLTFLTLHVFWWVVWFSTGAFGQDTYPFQFLTLVLSLEAIVLTTLVLFNQLRNEKQDSVLAENDRLREKRDLEVDEETLRLLKDIHRHLQPVDNQDTAV